MGNEGHRKRVKDKFCKTDIKNYYAYEIMEAVLFGVIRRRDTKPIAKALIEKFGNVSGVFDATKSEFLSCRGVGEKSYIFLNLLGDVWQYCEEEKANCQRIKTVREAGVLAQSYLRECKTQKFYITFIESSGRIINTKEIEETEPDKRIAEMMRCVAQYGKNADSMLIMSNHTDGSMIPTEEEKELTEKMRQLIEILNIKLFDHILVAEGKYVSLRKRGDIEITYGGA